MDPKYTSRLAIPFPDDRDEDWYGVEDGPAGRMEKLDKLLCIAIENQMLFLDGRYGYFSGEESEEYRLYVRDNDLVIRSAMGGDITFAQDSYIAMNDGDYAWFIPTARPIPSGDTGTLVAGSVAPRDAVVLFFLAGTKLAAVHNEIVGGR